MVPLFEAGSHLFIYNDNLTDKRLIHILFGSCIMLRSDVIHGGCCGGHGNTRLQISFIRHHMIENYRELGHINSDICRAKGFYHPPEVTYNHVEELLGVELNNTLARYPSTIKEKCFMGGNMFPATED